MNLSGGTFTIPSAATFTGPSNSGNYLNISGGTLSVGGTLQGYMNLNGGILAGAGTMAGTMIVNGSSSQITGTSLQNSGAMNFTSNGSIYVYSNTYANLTNLSSGVINFMADGTPFYLGGGATGNITNYGTIEKTGGSSTSTSVGWQVDFKAGCTINTQVGTLNFSSGGTLENGTFTLTGSGITALSNGSFGLAAGVTFTAPTNGGNYLYFSGGALTVNGTLAGPINWTGGTLAGGTATQSGTLAGSLYLTSSSNNQIISGNYLQNSGTIYWTSGGILAYSYTTPSFVNLPSGVINFQADGAAFIVGTGGSGIIYNQGNFTKSGGAGSGGTTVNWFVDFQNGSTINALSGTLNFIAGGTLENGTLTVSGSAVAALNAGTFTIPSGATFTSAGTGSNYLNWTGGALSAGSGGGTLAGTLIASGGLKSISVNTLLLSGTLAWTGGSINAASGSTAALYVLPTGVINFQVDGSAFTLGSSSTGTIYNQGTIEKSGGIFNNTSVGWSVDFKNGGILNAGSGNLYFDGGGILDTGTTTVTGTAVVALDNGTFTVASP